MLHAGPSSPIRARRRWWGRILPPRKPTWGAGVLYFHHPIDASGPPVITDPTQISGCFCWYRSDKGITLNGSNVSAWADQTANGFNLLQSNSTQQPPYTSSGGLNNRAFLSFNATVSPFLNLFKAIAQGPPIECFCVVNKTAMNANNEEIYCWGSQYYLVQVAGAVGPAPFPLLQGSSSPTLEHIGPGNISSGGHVIDSLHGTGGTCQTLVDGTSIESGTLTTNSATARLTVGTVFGGGSNQWFGDVYELAAWARALTSTEQASLHNYGSNLYGTP